MQDRDILYLSGCSEPGITLLISPKLKKPLLFAPKVDKTKILWDGPQYELKAAAKNTGAEVVFYKRAAEIIDKLRGHQTLFFPDRSTEPGWTIASSLVALSSHQRGDLPSRFLHSDNILAQMRLIKEPYEVECIERAIDITFNAWCLALPLISKGVDENLLAATLEYGFRTQGADYAFQSIVASGKNAAVLHYHKLHSRLAANDLVLFDFGAAYRGYAADISRTVPVGKRFLQWQRDLYQLVLAAQKAAIGKVRPGIQLKAVYDSAARIILQGLIDLKVIKGKASTLFKDGAHKRFFPHGIGHSLGLDVHDVGPSRQDQGLRLEKGMVFTIEPGIYLPKKIGKFPPCGIRIEDNVLVTSNGCRNLSQYIPKETDDLESLIRAL